MICAERGIGNLFRNKNGKNYHMQTNKQTEWSYVIYNPNNDRYLPILVENIFNLHKRSRILLQNLKVKKNIAWKVELPVCIFIMYW